MALLVTGVLGDVVEVLAADDDGTVHLGGHDGAGQDTATDRDLAGEGALLVCIETSPVNLLYLFVFPVASHIACQILHFKRRPRRIVLCQSLYWAEFEMQDGMAGGWKLGSSSPFVTYRCTGPQWQSWGCGTQDQRPCTISDHPCRAGST